MRQQVRMWNAISLRWLAVGLLLSWAGGCSLLISEAVSPAAQSFLQPAKTSPDSVTLEIFQARVPTSDHELLDQLWQEVDEQRLNVESRRDLIRNGFRVGVLGGALPDLLAEHLNLQSEMPEASDERVITGENADPKVMRRVMQLDRHESATLQASGLQDQRHVLISDDRGVKGRVYEQVQAVYSLRAEPVPGQRVSLDLTPELHHGELRNRYTGSDQGIFLVTPSREREIFDQLKLAVDLAPGELLVVSCLPESRGTLGHAFHAVARGEGAENKLLLVRLLQVPGSEILAGAVVGH